MDYSFVDEHSYIRMNVLRLSVYKSSAQGYELFTYLHIYKGIFNMHVCMYSIDFLFEGRWLAGNRKSTPLATIPIVNSLYAAIKCNANRFEFHWHF